MTWLTSLCKYFISNSDYEFDVFNEQNIKIDFLTHSNDSYLHWICIRRKSASRHKSLADRGLAVLATNMALKYHLKMSEIILKGHFNPYPTLKKRKSSCYFIPHAELL